jgi:hypothetical protein
MRDLVGLEFCVWELRMSNLELAETRLTFDDLLEAVQDSKRGRWFLKEYEGRIQKRDSQSILDAISKLETRMEHLGPKSANPDDLGKVRAAIANARSDLFKLGMGQDALSKEGRLFAEMAEMARNTMPEVAEKSAGIVRTLQLIDEIDRTITPASSEDHGAKFFAADSNLFDRPVITPKPVLVETAPPVTEVAAPKPVAAKKEDPAPTGAKLVIRKANQAAMPDQTLPTPDLQEVAIVEAGIVETEISEPPVSIQQNENPRIVIIRRKAEDMPEVSVGIESAA